jgi:site-specific DNA recombinase
MQSTDTARRVRDKHEAIAMAGIPVGGSCPFGWNEDKRTLHPVEAALLWQARKDILLGIGLHTICREWKAAGVKTPKGNDFSRQVLRNVLLNPRLAGYRIYCDQICLDYEGKPVMGQYDAIFEIAEWEDLRDYLTRDSRTAQAVHNGGLKYLLSGIVRCGLCGAKCCGRWDNRHGVHHYACPSPTDASGGCGKASINGRQLDAMITQLVLDYLSTLEIHPEAQPWPREAELAAAEAKISELMEASQANALPKEVVFPAVARLRGDVRTIQRDRSAWNREQMRAMEATTTVVDKWPELSVDRQRAVIASVVHTVAIRKPTIKTARFDPNRVEVVKNEDLAALSQRLAGLVGMSGSVLTRPQRPLLSPDGPVLASLG